MKEELSLRQLESLITVSNVLNSSLDIDKIIHSIMQVTISVLDAAEGGVLFLYNENSGYLVAEATFGFDPLILQNTRLKPGESMTGQSFVQKKCLLFKNPKDVIEATSTLTKKNMRLMINSIPNYPTSTLCAPIIIKDECIGVMTIDAFSSNLTFSEDDIKLLTAISAQAAVAIEKAQLYREKELTVKTLEQLNNTISRQNEMLSNSVEIHNYLANLVLQGKDTEEIINFMYHRTKHELFLIDDIGELIACAYHTTLSEEDIGKIQSTALSSAHTINEIWKTQTIFINETEHELITLPIGAKTDLFGTLVILTKEKINDIDMTTIEHACTVLSLELVKKQAIFDTQQLLKGEFAEELLAGRLDNSLKQQAKRMNLHLEDTYMAIYIAFRDLEQNLSLPNRKQLQIVHRVFSKHNPHCMVVTKNESIIVLLSVQTKSEGILITKEFLQEMKGKNLGEVKIGIGRPQNKLSFLFKSANEAQKSLQFLTSYDLSQQILEYSDLGVQRLLLQSPEEDLIEFTLEQLGPLLQYESDRKGELLQTLYAYFEKNQHIKDVTDSLHIHVNTLNYRLKRIKEILQTDWAETEVFLNIHLALQLYTLLNDKIDN